MKRFTTNVSANTQETIFFKDIADLIKYLLGNSFLNGKLPTSFETFFQRCSDIHNAPTRFSKSESLYMPRFNPISVEGEVNLPSPRTKIGLKHDMYKD